MHHKPNLAAQSPIDDTLNSVRRIWASAAKENKCLVGRNNRSAHRTYPHLNKLSWLEPHWNPLGPNIGLSLHQKVISAFKVTEFLKPLQLQIAWTPSGPSWMLLTRKKGKGWSTPCSENWIVACLSLSWYIYWIVSVWCSLTAFTYQMYNRYRQEQCLVSTQANSHDIASHLDNSCPQSCTLTRVRRRFAFKRLSVLYAAVNTLCRLHIDANTFVSLPTNAYEDLVDNVHRNMILSHFGKPSKYLPWCMIIWGILSVCTGATFSFFKIFWSQN